MGFAREQNNNEYCKSLTLAFDFNTIKWENKMLQDYGKMDY